MELGFSEPMETDDQKNNANEQGGRKQEAGGTPVGYLQNDWGTELGSSKKQLQLGGQSGTWTHSLRISSPVPWPLRYPASLYHLLSATLFKSHIVWFQKIPLPTPLRFIGNSKEEEESQKPNF